MMAVTTHQSSIYTTGISGTDAGKTDIMKAANTAIARPVMEPGTAVGKISHDPVMEPGAAVGRTSHPVMEPGTAAGGTSYPACISVGAMAMPADFQYKSVHLKGRPRHEKYSDFWCRHIPMDCAHRAKIFVAFDALKGFDEAIEEVQKKSENTKDIETCVLDIM